MHRLHGLRVLLLAAAVVLSGTVGYVVLENVSILDALYMTTITVTTIGFSEVFPLSSGGKVFTILLAVSGIGVILALATEMATTVLSADLLAVLGKGRKQEMFANVSDHIIVCGAGRMGRSVLSELASHGESVVCIECSSEHAKALEESGYLIVCGDATKEETLREARIEHARAFIACLPDDALNVYSILLARQLNPKATIIAREIDEEAEQRLLLAGADRVVNPLRLGGARLAYTALKPGVIDFIESTLRGTEDDITISQVEVKASSTLDGQSLAEATIGPRFGIVVVGLQRGEKSFFNPSSSTTIKSGDILITLGPAENIAKFADTCEG